MVPPILFDPFFGNHTEHMLGRVTTAPNAETGFQDKRAARRHDIVLGVQWTIINGRPQLDFGTGKTINLSSSGLLVATDRKIPAGLNIELSIEWPDGNSRPRQLLVTGRVVRALGEQAAIQITHHYFQPEGKPLGRLVASSFNNDAGNHSLLPWLPRYQSIWSLEERYRQSDGTIAMCMHCRRTRSNLPGEELWELVDRFIAQPPLGVSHGLCSPCLEQHYPGRP